MAKEQEVLTIEEQAIINGQKHLAEIEERIASEIEAGFLNPFGEGVNYKHFLGAIPAGVSVKEYLTGKPDITSEMIDDIEKDLAFYAPYKAFQSKLNAPKKGKGE